MPTLYLIGGPNGAGKSTHSKHIISKKKLRLIDPDQFIGALKKEGVTDKESQSYLINLEIEQILEENKSFVFESNLHKQQSYDIVSLVKKHNYRVELLFMSVDNIQLLYDRVEQRFANKGHHVSRREIKYRYNEGLKLLPSHIKMFDKVRLADSTNYLVEQNTIIYKNQSMINTNTDQPKWCKGVINNYLDIRRSKNIKLDSSL